MPRQQQRMPEPTTSRQADTGRRSYSSGNTSAADLAFDLDGVTFQPVGVPVLDMFEMAGLAGVDPNARMTDLDAQSLQMIANLWRSVFGADSDGGKEYNRFKAHTARHRTPLRTLMGILSDLLADAGKGAAQPASPYAAGPSTNVLPLSGHSPRSQQRPARSAEVEQVSPFTSAERRSIAIRKAAERDELRAMGFPDNYLSGIG